MSRETRSSPPPQPDLWSTDQTAHATTPNTYAYSTRHTYPSPHPNVMNLSRDDEEDEYDDNRGQEDSEEDSAHLAPLQPSSGVHASSRRTGNSDHSHKPHPNYQSHPRRRRYPPVHKDHVKRHYQSAGSDLPQGERHQQPAREPGHEGNDDVDRRDYFYSSSHQNGHVDAMGQQRGFSGYPDIPVQPAFPQDPPPVAPRRGSQMAAAEPRAKARMDAGGVAPPMTSRQLDTPPQRENYQASYSHPVSQAPTYPNIPRQPIHPPVYRPEEMPIDPTTGMYHPYAQPAQKPPTKYVFDRWAESANAKFYDNLNDHIELLREHREIMINPHLARGDLRLIVDLSQRLEDIKFPGISAERIQAVLAKYGEESATIPRVTEIRLATTKLEHIISVQNPSGVTVHIVLSSADLLSDIKV
ncbi:hypothetical protein DL93DRAFT_1292726 [Clavulina sp. PMI_390]|nr:hypothetical protein DL93DRAFT_1292726 [Clavulina sp. PMI_390]